MRTLVISDLHLGQRPGHDVLRRRAPLDRLLEVLADVDRLVLLGDVVELTSRRTGRRAMQTARPVLRAIGSRLGGGEIVYVPGNHDLRPVRAFVQARGRDLGLETPVPLDASADLAAVVADLGHARARVRVAYPGVWLGDRVWATHGHYLDRHLLPETTFGLLREGPGRAVAASAVPADYEAARRRRQRRREAPESTATQLRVRPLALALEALAELTRYGTQALRRLHLTTLTTRLIDLQMRRAALAAMGTVVRRLGVDADTVLFGHVHRLGPAAGEDWTLPGGPQLINTGSWLHEPLLLQDISPPHPYWPGGAVSLAPGARPRVRGLLTDLTSAELLGPADGDRGAGSV